MTTQKKLSPKTSNESVSDTDDVKNDFSDLLKTISTLKTQLSSLGNKVKSLEKSVNKKMKVLEKEAAKNRNKGNRKPSGFATPTKISDDLCKFMNKPNGAGAARTEVTKYIISYIKDNNLQSTTNKKIIQPDKALKSLLKPKKKEEVTFFNLQRYMNKHFLKQ